MSRRAGRVAALACLAAALPFAALAQGKLKLDAPKVEDLSTAADAFLSACTDEYNKKQDALESRWLKDTDGYEVDLQRGILRFNRKGKPKLVFDVEVAGSLSTTKHEWEWAWNNPNVVTSVAVPKEALTEAAEKYDLQYLVTGFVPAPEDIYAYYLSGIALKLRGALGIYVGEHEDLKIFMLLKNPRDDVTRPSRSDPTR